MTKKGEGTSSPTDRVVLIAQSAITLSKARSAAPKGDCPQPRSSTTSEKTSGS